MSESAIRNTSDVSDIAVRNLSDAAVFTKGLRGADQCHFKGYSYTKKCKKNAKIVRWICTHHALYKCTAALRTTSLPFANPETLGLHTHPPNEEELKLLEMRNYIREKAKQSLANPTDVLTSALDELADGDIPKACLDISSIKRDIRRFRQMKVSSTLDPMKESQSAEDSSLTQPGPSSSSSGQTQEKSSEGSSSKTKKGQVRKVHQTGSDECDPVTCSALACTNTSLSHRLVRLPKDPEKRSLWLSRINRQDLVPTETTSLCQVHFEEDAWEGGRSGSRSLKADALPTLNLHGEVIKSWVTLDKSGKVKDERVRNNSDDERNDEDITDSVFIKQEALEPHIEMVEGASKVKKPFEAVYLDSHIEEEADKRLKVENNSAQEEASRMPDITSVNIKAEPLDIVDYMEETNTGLSCTRCGANFDEQEELEKHVMENHGSNKRLMSDKEEHPSFKKMKVSNSLSEIPSTSTTFNSVLLQPTLPVVETPHQPLLTFVSPMTGSNQYVSMLPPVEPMYLPVTTGSSSEPVSSISLPSSDTSILTSTIDSSEGFYVSLAEFPQETRIGIKRKIMEVVKVIKKFKIDPQMIVIAHKAKTT